MAEAGISGGCFLSLTSLVFSAIAARFSALPADGQQFFELRPPSSGCQFPVHLQKMVVRALKVGSQAQYNRKPPLVAVLPERLRRHHVLKGDDQLPASFFWREMLDLFVDQGTLLRNAPTLPELLGHQSHDANNGFHYLWRPRGGTEQAANGRIERIRIRSLIGLF